MKFTFAALPTVFLIAATVAMAHSGLPSTVPAAVRTQQLEQLDHDLRDLAARRQQVAAQPTAPFLPRGGITPAEAAADQLTPWATASRQ